MRELIFEFNKKSYNWNDYPTVHKGGTNPNSFWKIMSDFAD